MSMKQVKEILAESTKAGSDIFISPFGLLNIDLSVPKTLEEAKKKFTKSRTAAEKALSGQSRQGRGKFQELSDALKKGPASDLSRKALKELQSLEQKFEKDVLQLAKKLDEDYLKEVEKIVKSL